jgi:glutamate/tyrosine decarboxylase-like PLP-dependent enzyme
VSGRPWLRRASELAETFLDGVAKRPVAAKAPFGELVAALGGPLPEQGADPTAVVESMARAADPGLVASAGPRYFGFVIGGSLPAALAADWLACAWDQDAGMCVAGPAAAAVEDVAGRWLLELFGLPGGSGFGFVTGGQMANYSGLIAARHAVLQRAGWDVEGDGLGGAPHVNVVIGEEAHATILSSLRMLGLGSNRARRVASDAQGRMVPDALARILAGCEGPTIVCAQAGNVNTGAFDPLDRIAAIAHERAAWLHVDGAFGLWAAAAPGRRALARGIEQADSIATDAHKWLNVPYDSGIVFVRDAVRLVTPYAKTAAYLMQAPGAERDPARYTPEASRRARGFAVYAALRSLGREGVAQLVERCCRLATRFAERLARADGVRVLNDVVLNQVLLRFEPDGGEGGDGDALTRAVVARIQREGTCWAGGTRWQGREAMRISVSNWSTTEHDVDRSADAMLAALEAERAGAPA